jgi:hypothetical protein
MSILNVVVPQVPGQFFGLAGTICVLFFKLAHVLLMIVSLEAKN